jgi:BASS family bile acid:Na+ symporter
LEIDERVFGSPLGISPMAVLPVVGLTIFAPLIAGVAVARFAPKLASRAGPLLARLGSLLLLVGAALILFSQWRSMVGLMHDGAVLAMAVFVIIGLVVGHLLGGPDADDRTVLSLATASRHPGVAFAIAKINFPEEKMLAAAVLLFLVVNLLLTAPYVAWRKRVGAAADLAAI